ncbi:Flocculation protein [Actinidia chinensis var. chinensis]|uniref:Flocculation protein n=1 Tax=Actinidia chinensis var. chinensis TaxID=1590841 RepID=A0A2R6QLS2_ACTCC|nr:Flocculation protein [Actinidia chinensis var. chinensis]
MAENPSLEKCELDEMDAQKISVADQTNSMQFTDIKSDSFTVDTERLSRLSNKDITENSRITLQRSFSRKGSQQPGSEKKINSSNNSHERDTNFTSLGSPRAALTGPSTPEKPVVVTVGTADHSTATQVHHQITIVTGNIGGRTTTESRCTTKRLSFRRSPPSSWTIDPRRILFFFATLSSIGTMLVIYFTLSMGKLGEDDSAMD